MKDLFTDELGVDSKTLSKDVDAGHKIFKIGRWTYDIISDVFLFADDVHGILETTRDEFDGTLEGYFTFVHPDDVGELKRAITNAKEGIEFDIEYRICTPKSIEKHVREKAKALYDEDNKLIKMIGIIMDITEDKIFENNSRAIGEDLNEIQKIAGVGTWKYDVKQNKFYATEEIYRIFGVDPMECNMTDKESVFGMICNEDIDFVNKCVDKLLSGLSCNLEFRIVHRDGSIRHVMGKGRPAIDENAQVISIFGTIQDITEKKLLENQLQRTCKNLNKMQVLTHVGSWEFDIINNQCFFSEEACRICGIDAGEFGTFEDFLRLVHPDDVQIIENTLNNPPNEKSEIEFRIVKDGTTRYLYQVLEFEFDQLGNPLLVYGTIQDITERKTLEEKVCGAKKEMYELHEKYKMLVDESNDAIGVISLDGDIQYMSSAVEKILNIRVEEILGKNIKEFFQGECLQKFESMLGLASANPGRNVQGQLIYSTKSNKKIYLDFNMKNLSSKSSVKGILVNIRDISKQVQLAKKNVYISTYDDLTGLPNRSYMRKKLKLECKRASENGYSFGLIMVDVVGFKYINEALGYKLADQLVIKISQRLHELDLKYKMVFRYFGIQFAIIVSELESIKECENAVKKLLDLFQRPFNVGDNELHINITVGVSIYPEDGTDIDSIKNHANIALLRAKQEAKKYKFYSSHMDIQNFKQFALKNDMHSAISLNQLEVYYQPIVDLKTNEILAGEVLIRWNHPDWGVVSPGDFISIAEESGYIKEIGYWTLRKACSDYRQIYGKGSKIKISINYSPVQFFENKFVDRIKRTIEEFKLDPKFLIIEITESVFLKNLDKAIADIKQLQSLGIQIALDDFGTGFSSLSYLNSFDIDILKIDRCFINSMTTDDRSRSITKHIVKLAKELKVKVVAEGIDDWDQLMYLRELECRTGQGYLYSKPLKYNEFTSLVAKKKCKPVVANNSSIVIKDRRKFFRIVFVQYLETDMTILKLNSNTVDIGYTKVLVKNIGPGGLCFVSNLKLPVEQDITLKFVIRMMECELKVCGNIVWAEELRGCLYEYGIEFVVDENERANLIKVLNQAQIKMKKNILYDEGNFISCSPYAYFKH